MTSQSVTCRGNKSYKPIEANISSMSLRLFWLVDSEILSHWLLFFCLSLWSPNTVDWLLFFCLFTFLALSPARSAKVLIWLLTECRRALEHLFVLFSTGQWVLFGARIWADKARWTFCLKIRNFLLTLQRRTNPKKMLSNYCKLFWFDNDTFVWFIK